MRLLVLGVVALGAGLLAAPVSAVRSSSNSDGMPDAGGLADAGPAPLDGGVARLAGKRPRVAKKAARVRGADGGPEVIYVGDRNVTLRNGPEPSDAGTRAAKSAAATAELQAQIAELRARTEELQARQSATQEQVQLLEQVNDQLRALNAQMSAAQAERAAANEQAAAQAAQVQQAIGGLGAALDMLASGNGDIGSALDAADQSFPPQARRDLAAVRDALTSMNLGLARGLVQAAINDAQAGR